MRPTHHDSIDSVEPLLGVVSYLLPTTVCPYPSLGKVCAQRLVNLGESYPENLILHPLAALYLDNQLYKYLFKSENVFPPVLYDARREFLCPQVFGKKQKYAHFRLIFCHFCIKILPKHGKKQILTGIGSAPHPLAGQNIQQILHLAIAILNIQTFGQIQENSKSTFQSSECVGSIL